MFEYITGDQGTNISSCYVMTCVICCANSLNLHAP